MRKSGFWWWRLKINRKHNIYLLCIWFVKVSSSSAIVGIHWPLVSRVARNWWPFHAWRAASSGRSTRVTRSCFQGCRQLKSDALTSRSSAAEVDLDKDIPSPNAHEHLLLYHRCEPSVITFTAFTEVSSIKSMLKIIQSSLRLHCSFTEHSQNISNGASIHSRSTSICWKILQDTGTSETYWYIRRYLKTGVAIKMVIPKMNVHYIHWTFPKYFKWCITSQRHALCTFGQSRLFLNHPKGMHTKNETNLKNHIFNVMCMKQYIV